MKKAGRHVRVVKGPRTGMTGVIVSLPRSCVLVRGYERGRSTLRIVELEHLDIAPRGPS